MRAIRRFLSVQAVVSSRWSQFAFSDVSEKAHFGSVRLVDYGAFYELITERTKPATVHDSCSNYRKIGLSTGPIWFLQHLTRSNNNTFVLLVWFTRPTQSSQIGRFKEPLRPTNQPLLAVLYEVLRTAQRPEPFNLYMHFAGWTSIVICFTNIN